MLGLLLRMQGGIVNISYGCLLTPAVLSRSASGRWAVPPGPGSLAAAVAWRRVTDGQHAHGHCAPGHSHRYMQINCQLLHRRILGLLCALGRCWQPVTTRVASLGLVPRSMNVCFAATLLRKKCRPPCSTVESRTGHRCVNKYCLAGVVHTYDCDYGGRQLT